MSAYVFSEEEILAVKTRFPKLELIKPGVWRGVIDFDRVYRDYRIADSYDVGIIVLVGFPQVFPIVHELAERIKTIQDKYSLKTVADLHYNINNGACLCVVQEKESRLPVESNLVFFIENLVVPYFYGLSYFDEQGRWPWKEYGHGGLGVLEHYTEQWKGSNQELIRSLMPTFSADKHWRKYRKQFISPNPHTLCFCESGIDISTCHGKAWEGIMKINNDLKALKINAYKFFPRPTKKK